MTFVWIFAVSWGTSVLLVMTWLVAFGWRGEPPQWTHINFWLALALALFVAAICAAIPAVLFSAAIWAAATKRARLSLASEVKRQSQGPN